MVCPRCGQPASSDHRGRCAACDAALSQATVGVGPATDMPTGGAQEPPYPSAVTGTFGFPDGATGVTTGTPETPEPVVEATSQHGPLKVGQSFGPRYHIIKLLGAGGMGAVYQAWDAELNVAVALKVIRMDCRRGPRRLTPRSDSRTSSCSRARYPQARGAHSRPGRNRRHQVHHDAVRAGDDLGTVLRRDGKLPLAARCGWRARWPEDSKRPTTPASSTAT